MFYSHEVLTSRKHGVATVWLVATLGSKSSLRKVNRKDIQAVNVTKACEAILTPDAPMALRLQSSLLYGVSRVYSQQCTYVLNDAQHAQQSIRAMFRLMKNAQLDPEAGRTRPDQLVLPDDPTFLPDIALGAFELDPYLSTSGGSRRSSSVLSPHTSPTDYSRDPIIDPIGGLDIPSSSLGGGVGLGAASIQGDEGPGSILPRLSDFRYQDDDMSMGDDVLEIDEDGNIIDIPIGEQVRRSVGRSGGVPSTPGPRLGSDAAVAGYERGAEGTGDEIQLVPPLEEDIQLPGLEEAVLPAEEQIIPTRGTTAPSSQPRRSPNGVAEESTETSEYQAPQRRRRRPKTLEPDTTLELRNSDLARWSNEYLSNMRAATKAKETGRATRQAKQNAEMLIIGRGIGNVNLSFGPSKSIKNPILASIFSSAALWESITTGTKRTHPDSANSQADEEEGVDKDGRRVRPRSSEEAQLPRSEPMDLDDAFRLPQGEDDIEIEFPREAPSALDAHLSDTMPWNITASFRQSSLPRPSSAGRPSSLAPPTGSLPRRSRSRAGSRIVSASPLVGRGLGIRSMVAGVASGAVGAAAGEGDGEGEGELPQLLGFDDDFAALAMSSDITGGGGDVGFLDPFIATEELQPPVDTQIVTAQSQGVRGALDAESGNFLEFVRAGVEGRKRVGGEEGEGEVEEMEGEGEEGEEVVEILFEELLPPERNTRLVAASGLLHVLSLATRGMVSVRQEEAFGEIAIGVVSGV
ncbi:MAG: hypothetical protein M1820_003029 [Bogoriella megaspora]|nr:MAG: hypothetical protein M1820_003029 [Bogoriella megaspora]